jgi:hypothetical protein
MASTTVLTNVDAYLEDSRLPSDAGYIPPLLLQPQYGFVPQRFNPGFPEIRDVSEKRPSQNGTFDFTHYFGARAITLEVALASELQDDPLVTDQVLEDQLRRWMAPDVRAYLYIRYDSADEYRRIKIRPSNLGSQLSFLHHRDFRKVSLGWRGVDGIFESAVIQSEFLEVAGSTELGRTYDQLYDKTYTASLVIGAKNLTNFGNIEVLPVIRIYGPCTQPRIENQTTGIKLEFLATYSIASGDYITIDFAEGTVLLNGDPSNSRYDKIDFASGISKWWTLIPGVNSIRFYPLSSSPPSKAILEWRSGYL